jgi:hypothetical protein
VRYSCEAAMDYVFQMSISDLLKIVSIVISVALNITVFVRWLKKRVVLDHFLAGQWDGTLTPKEECDHHHAIECTVMISKHRDTGNTAYIVYRRIDLGDDRHLIAVGCDTLIDYERDRFFFRNRRWNAKFVRVFHKIHNDKILLFKTRYDFECTAESLLQPRLRVMATLEDGSNWTGQWSKH